MAARHRARRERTDGVRIGRRSPPNGSIAGNDNDADATRFEPHYAEIRNADQVQVYEPVMVDQHGAVTTGLLHGFRYVKDNRLLPRGFDKQTADADVAVHGDAATDADFVGGGDRVRYVIDVGQAQGPFEVQAELRYQSIGYRWAQNSRRDTAEGSAVHSLLRLDGVRVVGHPREDDGDRAVGRTSD